MNVKATAKYIHMSPRKVRLVVDLVRGLGIEEARRQLMFSPKAAAKPVLKVLNSAVANAENNFSMDTTNFVVSEAFVNEGPTFHRFRPRAHGRAAAIRKRMSHITVEVGEVSEAGTTSKTSSVKEVEQVKEKLEKKPAKKTAKKKAVKKKAPAKKPAAKKTATKTKKK